MTRSFYCFACALTLTACADGNDRKPPVLPSSADQVGYAARYPAEVERVASRLDQGQSDVAGRTEALASYDEALADPVDQKLVVGIYQAADESGRSQAYAERARENATARAVLEENQGEVARRVAGSVQAAAQQKGCNAELGGVAAGALKHALAQRSQTRLREANRAFELIERDAEALGKRNVTTLEKQAEAIADASYIANVELPTQRLELMRLLDERAAVRRTLEEEESELRRRGGSEKRLAEIEEAQKKLDESQDADRQHLEQLEARIAATQRNYQKALDQLVAAVEKRGEPPAPDKAQARVDAAK